MSFKHLTQLLLAKTPPFPAPRRTGGTPPTTPARGRAAFRISAVRRGFAGSHVLSLPLAAGLPPLKRQIGGVCSLHSATLRSGHKPVLLRLKGGGAAPGRSRGPKGRKKRKRPCLRFFPCRSASCLPCRQTPAKRRTSPARFFGFM